MELVKERFSAHIYEGDWDLKSDRLGYRTWTFNGIRIGCVQPSGPCQETRARPLQDV